MKKVPLLCIMALLLSPVSVRADLVVQDYLSNGQQVVLDTATGYHWYRNLNDFTSMTYAEQIAAISGLDCYGNIAGGWHMASWAEMDELWTRAPDAIAGGFTPSWRVVYQYSILDQYVGRYDENYGGYLGSHDLVAMSVVYWDFGTSSPPEIDYYKDTFLPQLNPVYDNERVVNRGAWVTSGAPVVPVPGGVVLAAIGLLSATLGLKRLRRRHQE